MPRKLRRESVNGIHHVTAHGVDEEWIFVGDEDRIGYVVMLAATVKRFRWLCLGYCLMDTHLHLLIETPEANLAPGMRWLHGHYGAGFNREHGRDGHLFKGRYHDEPVENDGHLLVVAAYIAANPVAAGLCRDPRDWEWGSHFSVARGEPKPWLAHEHLVGRLDEIGGRDAYARAVATRCY